MTALAEHRPVFHSEADFQHALAWQLQKADPAARIRLELRPRRGMCLDVLVSSDGVRAAIELKYLVRRFQGEVDGEQFDLPDQSAHDIGRYDVIKDVVRTESFVAEGIDGARAGERGQGAERERAGRTRWCWAAGTTAVGRTTPWWATRRPAVLVPRAAAAPDLAAATGAVAPAVQPCGRSRSQTITTGSCAPRVLAATLAQAAKFKRSRN
jgi:hypothetical protein